MLRIDRATDRDLDRLRAFDPMMRLDAERAEQIARWVANGEVWIASADDSVIGFAVLTRNFFRHSLVELVIVGEAMRRRGYGRALVDHCVSQSPAEKVWTSTNESNVRMQALLDTAGFVLSGRVDNLDPGDPELIYVHLPRA